MTELETAAAEYTTKEKKFEEDAAKEKDKFKRLQSLAKKYRDQGEFNFSCLDEPGLKVAYP